MSAIEQAKESEASSPEIALAIYSPDLAHTGLDTKCNYFNKTWLEFTGRALEQELGEGWIEGVHPEDRAECLKNYLEAFRARRSFLLEYRLRGHDGEYRWMMDCGSPFADSTGHFAGYLGACYDITQGKLAEDALRKS